MLAIQKNFTKSFFALLSLPATAMGFALSVQIAALSWILKTKYNLDVEEIGIVWAAGPIAGIFGQLIIGVLSDKVWFWGGRRRPFILIGGTIAAMMLLALPNIGIISESMGFSGILTVAISVALMLDLAINVSFNPTRSVIADVTPEGKIRTGGYTWMQTVSGTFGVGAYLVSVIWDNYVLINIGVILVFLFSVVPSFFITEPKELEVLEGSENSSVSLKESFASVLPLGGFLLFGFFGIFNKIFFHERLDDYQNLMVIISVALTFGIGFYLMGKSAKKEENKLEFQKILLAHAFTWLGIQSMFVYFTPFIGDVVLPNMGDNIWANNFSSFLTGKELSAFTLDDATGNIVSLSFLFLNLVGALLPTLVLGPLSQKIGRVRTHTISIAMASIGYFGLAIFGNSEVAIYLLISIVGVGWAATISLPFAIMSERVDQAKMGLYMGIFNLSVVLPQLMSSLGMGKIIKESANSGILFYICGIALGISAILWLFVRESKNESGELSTSGGH